MAQGGASPRTTAPGPELGPIMGRDAIIGSLAGAAAVVVALLLLSRADYLLFHSIVEIFALLVAFGIFVLAWNTRPIVDNRYLLSLGVGSLFVGIVTMLHMFAYRGMGVFPNATTDLATQLWIISRLLVAASYLVAGVSLSRRLPMPAVFAGFAAVTAAALLTLFVWPVFPVMFRDGLGLTPLKIALEFVVIALLALSALLLWRHRDRFERDVLWLLVASIAANMAAELAFTLYADPYGVSNFVGHILWVFSLLFVYVAIIDTALRRPYSLLFVELKRAEELERSIADTLQSTIVMTPGHISSVEIGHTYLSATTGARVGGDFYDLFAPAAGHVAFMIGDVCGKGVEAAAATTMARVTLRGFAYEDDDPARVLQRTNEAMRMQMGEDKFITAVFGVIDTATGHVRVAAAGHPDPVLRSASGTAALGLPHAPPLAVLEGQTYDDVEFDMAPGDRLVLFSDGLIEAGWDRGEFGIEGVVEHLARSRETDPDVLVDDLLAAAVAHAQGPLADDVAIVALSYVPERLAPVHPTAGEG